METLTKAPPITVEQFLNFKAPPGYRAELLDGEIILSPDPKPIHHDVVINIFKVLDRLLGISFKVGMWTNVDLREAHYMPSPDVFVLTHESWRQAREENRYPLGSPILAVEVISPSNTEPNVLNKMKIYLRYGAVQVWNVYPYERRVVIHEAAARREVSDEESIPLPHPFPALQLSAGEFFILQ
jgi:Uma2 family endonuclease